MVVYKLSDAIDTDDDCCARLARAAFGAMLFILVTNETFNTHNCSGWLGDGGPAALSHYIVPILIFWLYAIHMVIVCCNLKYTCLDKYCQCEDNIPARNMTAKQEIEYLSKKTKFAMVFQCAILLLVTAGMGYYNFRSTDEPGIDSYIDSIDTSFQTSTLMPCVTLANATNLERPCNDQNLVNVYPSHYKRFIPISHPALFLFRLNRGKDVPWNGNFNTTWKFINDSVTGAYCHAENLTSVPNVCASYDIEKRKGDVDLHINCMDTDINFCLSLHQCLDFDVPFETEDFVCSNWRSVWNIYKALKYVLLVLQILYFLYIFHDITFYFRISKNWRKIGKQRAQMWVALHESRRYYFIATAVVSSIIAYCLFLFVKKHIDTIRDAKCWANPSFLLFAPHTDVTVFITPALQGYFILVFQTIFMTNIKYFMWDEMTWHIDGVDPDTGKLIELQSQI